jgi:hypothetical protein
LRPVHPLHLPPFAFTIPPEPLFYFPSPDAKPEVLRIVNDPVLVQGWLIVGAIQVVHIFAFVTVVKRPLRAYDREIRNTHSSLKSINLYWLRMGTNPLAGPRTRPRCRQPAFQA